MRLPLLVALLLLLLLLLALVVTQVGAAVHQVGRALVQAWPR